MSLEVSQYILHGLEIMKCVFTTFNYWTVIYKYRWSRDYMPCRMYDSSIFFDLSVFASVFVSRWFRWRLLFAGIGRRTFLNGEGSFIAGRRPFL